MVYPKSPEGNRRSTPKGARRKATYHNLYRGLRLRFVPGQVSFCPSSTLESRWTYRREWCCGDSTKEHLEDKHGDDRSSHFGGL